MKHTFNLRLFLISMVSALSLVVIPVGETIVHAASSNSGSTPIAKTPTISKCTVFPADNIWNYNISNLPVHRNSANYVANMGSAGSLNTYFGAPVSGSDPRGMPYVVVKSTQPKVPITFLYASESNRGPYPIPTDAPIEGGPNSTIDRHVIVIDSGSCKLYEMWWSFPQPDGSWTAGSGAVWNLNSDQLRPKYWTTADAAGLPIFPGLVRYDEIAAGAINHALRVTANLTQASFLWPARHFASSSTDPNLPPMGLRLRLKANIDISSFSPQNQVILTALKKYGMFVADNDGEGGWSLCGPPDSRWDNNDLAMLQQIPGSAFEAVDESSLQASANSGKVKAGR